MYNAAIIVFRKSILPVPLNLFAAPGMNQIIEVGNNGIEVMLYIIDCPVLKRLKDNRRVAKLLYNLCIEKNISFFIPRNIEHYLGSGLECLESSIEMGTVDEVDGIKGLAALIKLSAERNTNLLKKNIFFIGKSHSYTYISTLSEEAAGVFIYEHEKMDESSKKKLFGRLMAEKGISAVFTKELSRGIMQCEIIAADDTVELQEYQESLSGKLILGVNPAEGNFEKVSQVRLWYDSLEGLTEDNAIICFNNEILGILRHYYRERDSISFIRQFPYIYMLRFPPPTGTRQ